MAKVLGIDLGTTNSCMAVIEAGDAKANGWMCCHGALRYFSWREIGPRLIG